MLKSIFSTVNLAGNKFMTKQEQPPQSKKEQKEKPQEGDIMIKDGIKYRYTKSPYTLRQYYSHSTPEMGPGPGWDFRTRLLDDEWAMEEYGMTFDRRVVFGRTKDLPDLPLYFWEEVFEDEEA